jgi:AraC-like DNA-binding protein
MQRQALPNDGLDPAVEQQQSELASLIERYTGRDGVHPTAVPCLFLYRSSTPSGPLCNVQEPAFGIIAQGSKQVTLGDDVYVYGRAHCIVVSVDLPVIGQVILATPDAPYLGLRIDLDIRQLRTLIVEAGLPEATNQQTRRGLFVSRIGSPLLGAVLRLMRLLENPQDIPVLAPLILREIHYRLLGGDQGARLRQIALTDSQSQRIAKAIAWLKRNFAEPLRIETIARELHMSPSSLHHHFKAVTAMSPLQYQKQLRLQEARRLMLSETLDAATAGHRVGYESPSQFSREYSRLFGSPPVRDLARLRASLHGSPAEVVS